MFEDELKRRGHLIHRGYTDDPRNTDNAWIETTAIHVELRDGEDEKFKTGENSEIRGRLDWIDVRCALSSPCQPDFVFSLVYC